MEIDHKAVEKLVSSFAAKVGAPAAMLAGKVLAKPLSVSPSGRIDPLMKGDAAKDAWTKIVNEYSRALGTNLVYALLNKVKAELGLK
jgi:hypothetical protein